MTRTKVTPRELTPEERRGLEQLAASRTAQARFVERSGARFSRLRILPGELIRHRRSLVRPSHGPLEMPAQGPASEHDDERGEGRRLGGRDRCQGVDRPRVQRIVLRAFVIPGDDELCLWEIAQVQRGRRVERTENRSIRIRQIQRDKGPRPIILIGDGEVSKRLGGAVLIAVSILPGILKLVDVELKRRQDLEKRSGHPPEASARNHQRPNGDSREAVIIPIVSLDHLDEWLPVRVIGERPREPGAGGDAGRGDPRR